MGSPLLLRKYGPVTTDPSGKGPVSVSSRPYTRLVTNLRLDQYAGSQQGLVDVASYISGYVDGEGCFTVSVAPRPLLVGWEVRPSLPNVPAALCQAERPRVIRRRVRADGEGGPPDDRWPARDCGMDKRHDSEWAAGISRRNHSPGQW